MNDIIRLENKYYIAVNSNYADDRIKALNHADTFAIFDRWGNIRMIGEEIQGIYHNGMRFVNELELRINDRRPLLLSSSVKEENEILSVDMTNPAMEDVRGRHVPKDVLYIGRSKFLRDGACYEQIRLSNYGNEAYEFELTLSFNADFKDIFEVRGITRAKRGEVFEIVHLPEHRLRISYAGLDDIQRSTEVYFSEPPAGWQQSNQAIFKIKLQPHEQKNFDYTLMFLTGNEKKKNTGYTKSRKLLEDELKNDNKITAKINTSNGRFNQWIDRSQFDLLSLLANTEHGKYPYAGVPWYNTAFGRDGIITALQTLWIGPDIARDVLLFLANTQAREVNSFQDAEPGKIIHEVRSGEMVELGEIPFKRYYGSVDATPLFIVLAGAYYTRTGDIETIKKIWSNIEAALEWIEKYGDIDGDGFIDYQHKSENGLTNQGWKDSYDSIFDENGRLADPPIALCEVQGYVYAALVQAAMLALRLNLKDQSKKLEQKAASLKTMFNERFWDEELQCFVIALDRRKKICRVISSNAGQCLFTGIADNDKAEKVINRLMQPDMFTGWGIRTLSQNERRYNPISYHNGSVWPHDVAVIAKGFSRYGFVRETLKLTAALFDASLFIDLQRLPELFCGFDRRRNEGPTNYPVACSPQAWAVGSVFMLLEACLNIRINADEKTVKFCNPHMPIGVVSVEIGHLKLSKGYAGVELTMLNDKVELKITECPEGWQIAIEP